MTPVFNRRNKTLIMLPNKWIRIKHTPQSKIDNAKSIVLSALDRFLPFAYQTVKPMYYLEKVKLDGKTIEYREKHTLEPFRQDGKYLTRYTTHTAYVKRKSVDMQAKNKMTSNYYKLRKALRLLHREGYIHSFVLRADHPILQVRWECDVKHEPIKIEHVDYSYFADYKPEPHRPRFKIWRQEKVRQREEERAILVMRKVFPIDNAKQGMLDKQYEGPEYNITPDDPGYVNNSAWSPRDFMNHEIHDQNMINQDKHRRTDEFKEKLMLSTMIALLHWGK